MPAFTWRRGTKLHQTNAATYFLHDICDKIKGNESDVGDVVFEILAKTVGYIVFSIDKFFATLYPDIQSPWGLYQNEAF